MASSKLSALTAITSAGDDDLIYVADTADGGSSYSSKRITRANLFTGMATEAYVTTQLSNLVDGAPGALDTLNELAAAMADDASFSTTITNLINANETHIDNVATLSGVAKDSVNFGTFTGSTVTDNQTLKAILQLLETAVEARATSVTVAEVDANVDDLVSLSGVAENTTGLGTFTGSTISDDSDIKTALQDLETAAEGAASGSAVADRTKTETGSANSTHYMTFVADDNASATAETVFTDAGVQYNPALNALTVAGRVHALTLTLDSVDVTSTAAELNVLDGVTATTAELNYVDGVTSNVQTQLDAKTADGDNVNNLVGVTSADAVPTDSGADNYLFLVVDKSNGAIKAIDKTFLEAEG
ncbi:MAG: hypothetical protein CL855_04665 [Cryomorphaceae bacterium]|nr:hypothetical protein [Cryomorphaceae bacterium]|tara:strand:- start:2852 stop:3934 length:1083 start_codon:yes stop_codon:yes gene_type:complete